MKWKNKGNEYDRIAKEILSYQGKYYIWGAANSGRIFYDFFKDKIKIEGFIDSRNDIENHCGLAVITKEEIPQDVKMIIASKYYLEIKEELEKISYKENIDFWSWNLFQEVYMLYEENKLVLNRVDISLTSGCTLKCKNCNMFMPYYKEQRELSIGDFTKSIDNLFEKVDYINMVNLLGGEPFLYKQLEKCLSYLCEKYVDIIGQIEIFTNAMIIPSDALLQLIKKYQISIQISDYTSVVDYKKRIEQFINKLNNHSIKYTYYDLGKWLNFGFPNEKLQETESLELEKKFDLCTPPFRGLVGNRLYYCHLEASAEMAGIFTSDESDYIDLKKASREEIMEFDLGYNQKGYLSFCKVCRGCETVNNNWVAGGIQIN